MLTERFLGVCLLALGLSHVINARAWAALFAALSGRAWAGPLIGALTFPLGVAIVLLHNVWVAHFALLTTLVGWAYACFGAAMLLSPVPPEALFRLWARPAWLRGVGVALTALGGVILAGAFARF